MSERDKHREKLESILAKWNADFDKLDARIRNSGADPKVYYDEVITGLRQHHYNRFKTRAEEQ